MAYFPSGAPIGGTIEINDAQGVWLGPIESETIIVRDPTATPLVRILIPWRYIITIGMVDSPTVEQPNIGFATSTATKLTGPKV